VTPAVRAELAGEIVQATEASERRVCEALTWPRTSVRYVRKRPSDEAARSALRKLAAEHPRFGYRRLHVMLGRESIRRSRKTVLRLCKEENLSVRRKRKVTTSKEVVRTPTPPPERPNEGWALDFTHEQLASGERFRILTVVDLFTREVVVTQAAASFKADDVRVVLRSAIALRDASPTWLRSDNGSEFIAELSAEFLRAKGIEHKRSRPGKPTDNPIIESFHSRFRDELLDRTLFDSVADANDQLSRFQHYYNHVRPHSGIRYLTPAEFHARHLSLQSHVAQ